MQTVGLGGPLYLFWLCGRGKDPGWPEKGMLLESPAWPEKGMLLGSPAVARGPARTSPTPRSTSQSVLTSSDPQQTQFCFFIHLAICCGAW